MITSTINPIGDIYNASDMIVDTVEEVCSIKLESDTDTIIIEEGNKYNDGIVVGIFIHPESDCVWIVVEYNGTFFEIMFDGFIKYTSSYIKGGDYADE